MGTRVSTHAPHRRSPVLHWRCFAKRSDHTELSLVIDAMSVESVPKFCATDAILEGIQLINRLERAETAFTEGKLTVFPIR